MCTRVAFVALLGLLGACYNYLPLTAPDPRPGTRVSVELTDSGSAVLSGAVGPNVGTIEGQLVTISDREVELSVVAVQNRNGIEHYWKGERVTLPRTDVARLRERKLALGRSVFLAVAGVGGSIALLEAFGAFGAGSTTPSNPPPPQ